MDGMDYFDPLYGAVKLNDIFRDLLSQKELLRLQSIGLMNYRSLNKLSLTSISRLEHSIGTAILFNSMYKNNSYLKSRYNDYICAALYHDVNCASFGHAVEWAISRYKNFDHVEKTSWLLDKKSTLNFDKPLSSGANPTGSISKDVLKQYGINTEFVDSVIKGKESCVICDKSMDLDNIDNVSRMALYMGVDFDRTLPVNLATNLNINDEKNVFIIDKDKLYLVQDWVDLRHRVYRSFIYSADYISYEFMIFSLVRELYFESGEIALRNIKNLTDDELLRKCLELENEKVTVIAKKMIGYELPECVCIISTEDLSYKDSLKQHADYLLFKNMLIEKINYAGVIIAIDDFDIHITTDYRKTYRKVTVSVDEQLIDVGQDVSKVLFGLIVNNKDKVSYFKDIASVIIDHLKSEEYQPKMEEVFFMDVNQSLFNE